MTVDQYDDQPLIFAFDDELQSLKVIYIAPDKPFRLDEKGLHQAIKQAGFSDLLVDDKGVNKLLEAIKDKDSCKVTVAQKLDAEFELEVSKDRLYLYLTVFPSFGGKPLDKEVIKTEIAKRNIKSEIFWDEIDASISEGYCEDILISKGEPPRKGEDTVFHSLISDNTSTKTITDEHGNETEILVHEFNRVSPGDVLMKRIPAKPGIPGKDIFGEILSAPNGQEFRYPDEIQGAEISTSDPNILVSTASGHPVVRLDHVRVDEIQILVKVDHSTGNVNFDGSVYVEGDVDTKMKVVATGDIVINGSVRQSVIESGASVIIDQGITGEGTNLKQRTLDISVKADGWLKTAYISQSRVEVNGNIQVRDYITHSYVKAEGSIEVGVKNGKGNIIGGEVTSLTSITANSIGSNANVTTKLHVGAASGVKEQYDRTLVNIQKKEEYLLVLSQALIRMGEIEQKNPESKKTKSAANKLAENLRGVVPELNTLEDTKKELRKKLYSTQAPHILVRKEVFGGVNMVVGHHAYRVTRSAGPGIYVVDGDKVVHKMDQHH